MKALTLIVYMGIGKDDVGVAPEITKYLMALIHLTVSVTYYILSHDINTYLL